MDVGGKALGEDWGAPMLAKTAIETNVTCAGSGGDGEMVACQSVANGNSSRRLRGEDGRLLSKDQTDVVEVSVERKDGFGQDDVNEVVRANGRNEDVINNAFKGDGAKSVGSAVEGAICVGSGHGVGQGAASKNGTRN